MSSTMSWQQCCGSQLLLLLLRASCWLLISCSAAAALVPVPADSEPARVATVPGSRCDAGTGGALLLHVFTGWHNASVSVDGRLLWWRPVLPVHPAVHDPKGLERRGVIVLVLHPGTGRILDEACFSGWMNMDTGHHFRQLVADTLRHSLLVFVSLGEVGPGVRAIPELADFMRRVGARHFHKLQLEDRYVLVCTKDGAVHSEAYVTSAGAVEQQEAVAPLSQAPLRVSVTVPCVHSEQLLCSWKGRRLDERRALFCADYNGYGQLCDCDENHVLPLTESGPLANNNLLNVPVAVVAGNRPKALWRTLRSLLSNPGAILDKVIVYVDGEFEEVTRLCHLIDIRCVSLINEEYDTTLRIRKHYKSIFTRIWEDFPQADRAIFLEEDLQVSPDFIGYFSQTSYLLDADPSLWCVSAWNDNGYDVSSSDPALLYRVEYMPGLGWMMTRRNIEALLARWPSAGHAYDWDVWVRWDSNRLGRECVIPDVSRTYHFGVSGRHLTGTFHTMYYVDHALNNRSHVQLYDVSAMVEHRYEEHLRKLMTQALPLHPHDFVIEGDMSDGGGGECRVNVSREKNKVYTVFFSMKAWEDTDMFRTLAKCFMIWDLDVRGHHHGLWRFTYYDHHILMFGVPITRYMNDAMQLLRHPIEVISRLGE